MQWPDINISKMKIEVNAKAYFSAGINFKEIEFTQCLVFFVVNLSPANTCPR